MLTPQFTYAGLQVRSTPADVQFEIGTGAEPGFPMTIPKDHALVEAKLGGPARFIRIHPTQEVELITSLLEAEIDGFANQDRAGR